MGASSQRALEEQLADERLRDAAPELLDMLNEFIALTAGYHGDPQLDELWARAVGLVHLAEGPQS
jgi:hypothetical protein